MDNLTDADMLELARLGKVITLGLSCDINGSGWPCRTDRLYTVEAMKDYLRLHDYQVVGQEGV